MITRFHEVFLRHPGVYDAIHDTERPGKKDGEIDTVRVATFLRIGAEQVITLCRRVIAEDPSATMTIFAATRGDAGCIGWINRKNIDSMLQEVGDDVALPRERKPAALVLTETSQGTTHVDGVPDAPPTPRRRAPAAQERAASVPGVPKRRGVALTRGTGLWPPSEPSQIVREFFADGKCASVAEVLQSLGERLKALGVAHPSSLISRLKQNGALTEATSAEESPSEEGTADDTTTDSQP